MNQALTERAPMKIACNKGRGVSITSLDEDKTMIVSFEDHTLRFDIAEPLRHSLREFIRSKLGEGYLNFVLNFHNVKIVDSTGIGLILMAHKTASSHHARLYLCHLRPVIVKELDVMRLSKHLAIFDTEEEALAEVRKGLA